MPRIIGERLKSLRKAKALKEGRDHTQEDVARGTHIEKGTISRLERGERSVRARTLESLARYFEVSPEVLSGHLPLPEQQPPTSLFDNRSQYNIRIRDAARNALQLVSARYHISSVQILELAPFLFEWAATESLKRRRETLSQLKETLERADQLRRESAGYLHPALSNSWRAEEILEAEENSIETYDILGVNLEGVLNDDAEIVRDDYEVDEAGPFVEFLKRLAEGTGGLAEFERWSDGPDYRICRAEALKFADDDSNLAESILDGSIPLHEIPKEIRPNKGEKLSWLKARHERVKQQLSELYGELNDLFGPLSEVKP